MAAIDYTRNQYTVQPGGGLTNLTQTFFSAFTSWNNARVTRKELNKLSDHELADIGLCRGDIEAVVARRFG